MTTKFDAAASAGLDRVADEFFNVKRISGETDRMLSARILKIDSIRIRALIFTCDCGAIKANTTHSHWCSICK